MKNAGRISRSHGTGALSSLVQIIPHAIYIFIDHDKQDFYSLAAIKWMAQNNIQITYDIEVINLYWSELKIDLEPRLNYGGFWGDNTYTLDNFKSWFDDIANSGGRNQKVITVAPAASTGRTYHSEIDARFPAALPSVIGVTGVYDRNWVDYSWMLKTGVGDEPIFDIEKDNNGFGIDIAAIDNYTTLSWTILETPLGAYNKFDGTCNAAVFVAGITVILKQKYDPLTVLQLQQTLKDTGDVEGDSPLNYGEESGGGYVSLDPYDDSYYFGWYPGNYRVAWGIIDAYETYVYIVENIIP
ncbi:MAG: S8/S53 family peptidase [Candidatus Heimdallarchaeota archaeon]|nr:S8/S53 family peptidase [Candidatus Heimdallarchaeota archaeon]MCK4610583.1 S8/S53 family peptidase [Candidatus Heimdallarchaeota archaeon]